MNMATRDITLTETQIRMIKQWAAEAWKEADDRRMRSRPDSPQEDLHRAEQLDIELLQEKLRRS